VVGLTGEVLQWQRECSGDQQDPNDNVPSVSDDSGNILERYAYDPFGQVTALNPDGTQEADPGLLSVQFQPEYLFQGLREDAATNTVASATRVYSPSLGTWMQPEFLAHCRSAGRGHVYRGRSKSFPVQDRGKANHRFTHHTEGQRGLARGRVQRPVGGI
jgi:hypothetical protein